MVVVTPSACGHCGADFPAALPCRRPTWAELPTGVSRRYVGPRVQALAELLTGACRLSRRQVQALLQDLCGLRVSLGTLISLEVDVTQALAAPYQEFAEAVPSAPVLGVDEMSWREGGTLHWLWTAVTPRFAFYRLDRHRSRTAFVALLGGVPDGQHPPEPVLITDRFSEYSHLPDTRWSAAGRSTSWTRCWSRGSNTGRVPWIGKACSPRSAPNRRSCRPRCAGAPSMEPARRASARTCWTAGPRSGRGWKWKTVTLQQRGGKGAAPSGALA